MKNSITLVSQENIIVAIYNHVNNKYPETFEEFYLKHIPKDLEKALEMLHKIEEFSFYDMDNYIYKKENKNELLQLVRDLSKVKSKILNRLGPIVDPQMYRDYGELERLASPPMATYEYLGVSKRDITPTNRSYGLLLSN
jgi:hypothetical protein